MLRDVVLCHKKGARNSIQRGHLCVKVPPKFVLLMDLTVFNFIMYNGIIITYVSNSMREQVHHSVTVTRRITGGGPWALDWSALPK